jgi:hypothetical protein
VNDQPLVLVLLLGGAFAAYQLFKGDKVNTPIYTDPIVTEDAPLSSQPLGVRNNNAGNIKWNARNDWVGQTGQNKGFVVFDTPENGIRAMAILIRNDILSDRPTIKLLIEEWSATDQEPYIEFVADRMRIGPNDGLDINDLEALVEAVIAFENGKAPYAWETIYSGVALA